MSYSSGVLEADVVSNSSEQVVDGGPPVDAGLVVRQRHDHRLLLVVLVLDLADDLLDQVLDGDEAGRPAVLVEDDGDVDARAAARGAGRRRSSTRARRPASAAASASAAARPDLEERQQVLGVEDADDLVDGPRRPGCAVALVDDRVDRVLDRRVVGSATMSMRGTMTSWTRWSPSSMTAWIICSSSASRMPCSPPCSMIRRSSSELIRLVAETSAPTAPAPSGCQVRNATTARTARAEELDEPRHRHRHALRVGEAERAWARARRT